jgi:hypothetical protein
VGGGIRQRLILPGVAICIDLIGRAFGAIEPLRVWKGLISGRMFMIRCVLVSAVPFELRGQYLLERPIGAGVHVVRSVGSGLDRNAFALGLFGQSDQQVVANTTSGGGHDFQATGPSLARGRVAILAD